MNKYRLCKNSNILIYKPEVNFFIEKVKKKEYFSFVKLNHDYWRMRLGHSYHVSRIIGIHGEKFVNELQLLLKQHPSNENFLISIGLGDPNQICEFCPNKVEEIIKSSLLTDIFYSADIWRSYVISGEMHRLIDHFRKMHVLVVGFDHLRQIKKSWGIKNFHFLELKLDATEKRFKILEEIDSIRKKICGDMVCLLQAGDTLGSWFVCKLKDSPKTFCINIGRALDVWTTGYSFKEDAVKNYFPDINNQLWQKNLQKPTYRNLPIL